MQATEAVAQYFQEQPNATGYFAQVNIGSNVKAMQSILNQGKSLGKAVYILSVDEHAGKVTHGNYLPAGLASDGFDARSWASSVAEVLGGKVCIFSNLPVTFLTGFQVGGKPDTAQGVGSDPSKVAEGVKVAQEAFVKATHK